MPDDVSSRILAAAALAGQAAAKATQGGRVIRIEGGVDATGEGWSQISVDFGPQDQFGSGPGCMLGAAEDGELAEDDARLIAASGPSHWGAVARMLRGAESVGFEIPELIDLADQITRDLGDGQ